MRMAYSEDFIANALAALTANGGIVNRTARELGIAESTLRFWKNRTSDNETRRGAIAESYEEKKADLADLMEGIVRQALGLLPGKLPEASVRDLVGAVHVGTDKMRLLRGESTEHVEHTDNNEYERLLSERLNRIRTRKAAPERN